ncbi:ABC transporter permease [Bacillus sp. RD4P76]|uniref:Transport permease protein n=2 Tax=Bacillus suaedaesalsae TaxID=2810349 RepID=A0ABS2DK24_9BACI|nr:ABC transporter permease [Bacillus suaedaesalsae]
MFLAQLRLTLREKQAWFWGIFFPVILMVIFMTIFSGDNSNDEFKTEVAIVSENSNATSDMMLEQLKQIPVIEIYEDGLVSQKEANELVREQEIDAAIILPREVDATEIGLIVNKENESSATTQVVAGILDKFVQQANLAVVGATPTYELQIDSITAGTNTLEYTDFLLTGMIALSIAQGGLFGMVGLVDMRRKGLIKRLRMTPANMGLFGLSDMLVRLLFSCIQITLLTLIGVFVFGANVYINVISLLFVFLVGALSFNAIGYLISSFSNTNEAYMGVANITSFVMMFLSGIFFPVETMPEWLQPFSNILPLTYFADGLRDSMVYNSSIATSSLWLSFGNMVIWGGIAFLIGSLLYKRKSIVETR